MNMALDALWWRLTRPEVRDLASILTMPALWQTDCELSVRTLLGEQGFRYLIDLNDDLSFRLPERAEQHLLGKYAENLLAFWLANAPHCRLLARNVPIFDDNHQSLGELDFIAQIGEQIYHIELACKYFGSDTGQPETMRGLNQNDILLNKINKLKTQLAWSQHDFGRCALRDLGLDNIDNIQSVSVVRGMAFTLSGCLPSDAIYPANAWTGLYLKNLEDDVFKQEKWFYRLPKNAFLSPARISGSLKQSLADLGDENGLIAVLAERPDGYFHEIQRFMLLK